MKIITLISGGKDSIYSTYLATSSGENSLEAALSVYSKNPNSWMFHTANIKLTELQAKSMSLPFYSTETKGEKEKELKDLESLIQKLVSEKRIEGIVVGATGSEYQRSRIKKISDKFGIELIVPLWGLKEEKYMNEMIEKKFEVIITKVAAQGLEKKWLGRKLDFRALRDLKRIRDKFKINLSGEGGEYETLVLDCPIFKERIRIDKFEKIWKDGSGFLKIEEASLVEKN